MQSYPPEKQFMLIYTAKTAVIVSLLFVLCSLILSSSCFMGGEPEAKRKTLQAKGLQRPEQS